MKENLNLLYLSGVLQEDSQDINDIISQLSPVAHLMVNRNMFNQLVSVAEWSEDVDCTFNVVEGLESVTVCGIGTISHTRIALSLPISQVFHTTQIMVKFMDLIHALSWTLHDFESPEDNSAKVLELHCDLNGNAGVMLKAYTKTLGSAMVIRSIKKEDV
jgi:hypothetical protein